MKIKSIQSTLSILTLSLIAMISPQSQAQEADPVMDALKGQYILELTENDYTKIVIRSSGEIMQVSAQGELEYSNVTSQLSWLNNADNDIGPSSVPVAQLALATGSDEETEEYMLLLTALRDGNDYSVKLLSVLHTFSDGPNDFTDANEGLLGDLKVKKYNTTTQQYETLN